MADVKHPEHQEREQVDYIEPIEAGKAFTFSLLFFLTITALFTVIEVLIR